MKYIAVIIMVLYLLFLIAAYALFYAQGESGLRERIRSYENLAPVVYILLLTTAMMTAFTGSAPVVMLGAAIFGKYLAFLYSMIGAGLAVNAAYIIGRLLGKDIVRLVFDQEKVRRIETKISRGISIWVLVLLRAVPHPLYDAVSYASGFAGVPYWKYLGGSVLGLIPAGALLCFIGEEVLRRYVLIFLLFWLALYSVMVVRLVRLFRQE
jgi:uncharacterized membrane protein YdjX (TVP38/TMEM64 family)